MKIVRVSIDLNYHNQISPYERTRISLMAAHIERLLFYYGVAELQIPNCNFIHLAIQSDDTISNYKIPSGIGVDKMVSLNSSLDIRFFFELQKERQLEFLLDQIYKPLINFLKINNLDSKILTSIHESILVNNFYLPFSQKKSENKMTQIVAIPFSKWLYDLIDYRLIVKDGKDEKQLRLCTLSPIFIPAEHPGESPINYVSFPSVEGWINENTFKITCGHKEYNFYLDKMNLEVIEHEELKSKFINWESVD